MEQTSLDNFGFEHFLMGTDSVGKVVLFVLLVFSVCSWYLILTRSVDNLLSRKQANAFIARFWSAKSTIEINNLIQESHLSNVYSALTKNAINTLDEMRNLGVKADGSYAEYFTRTIENEIEKEAADCEYGLTLLASAGSAAPYVGLFGTVWGIYHALVQIGMSGQGTLDKVAGPVGEALIMTALGLAVAIPAVLAYNAFNRRNRDWISKVESFSHELFVLFVIKSSHSSEVNPSNLRRG